MTLYNDIVMDAYGGPRNIPLVLSCGGQMLGAQSHPAQTEFHLKYMLLSFLLSAFIQHYWSPLRMSPYSVPKYRLEVQVVNNPWLMGDAN